MRITTLNIRRKIAEISQSLQEKEEKIEELELMAKILKNRIQN
jgi:hypothetical protein